VLLVQILKLILEKNVQLLAKFFIFFKGVKSVKQIPSNAATDALKKCQIVSPTKNLYI
jgi:hypothetical protein